MNFKNSKNFGEIGKYMKRCTWNKRCFSMSVQQLNNTVGPSNSSIVLTADFPD
jgi:hypothetical protein